jgi:SAM-dependent methyltransferase
MQLTYFPGIFNVNDIPQAMSIILTPEDATTEERWKTETPYVADLIGRSITITSDSILLDYGCGIGRMAKELIARHGCRVIGVDISDGMRALAVIYVQSDRFCACAPAMLDGMIGRGLRFDSAISIWVLQHCHRPADDAARIRRGLGSDGRLFVLNNLSRVVPTVEHGWVNDGIDIKQLLSDEFALQNEGRLPREKTTTSLAEASFWALYRQRPAATFPGTGVP